MTAICKLTLPEVRFDVFPYVKDYKQYCYMIPTIASYAHLTNLSMARSFHALLKNVVKIMFCTSLSGLFLYCCYQPNYSVPVAKKNSQILIQGMLVFAINEA